MVKTKDLEYKIGRHYGKLIVLDIDVERNQREIERKKAGEIKQARTYCLCECQCGNIVSVKSCRLVRKGGVKSCGHCNIQKRNDYDLTGEYGICYLPPPPHKKYQRVKSNDPIPVKFDLEDYKLLKNIPWRINAGGYAWGFDSKIGKRIRMHKLITHSDENTIIDHINRDRLDNRKCNLRTVTRAENRHNANTNYNNKSGIQGVNLEGNKWRAKIVHNGISEELGMYAYDDFESAVIARLKAEKKYFGEFAMQRDLFEKYGIE